MRTLIEEKAETYYRSCQCYAFPVTVSLQSNCNFSAVCKDFRGIVYSFFNPFSKEKLQVIFKTIVLFFPLPDSCADLTLLRIINVFPQKKKYTSDCPVLLEKKSNAL